MTAETFRFSTAKWFVLFALVCVLLFARYPEPLTTPWTFPHEVGSVYLSDSYNLSFFQSIRETYAGYYCVLPRILAELCGVFPLSTLPFVYPLVSLLAAAGILSFFYAPAFRSLIAEDWQRFAICVVLCAAPAAQPLMHFDEIHIYLTVFVALVAIAELPRSTIAAILLAVLTALSIWSAPGATVLLPAFLFRCLRPGTRTRDRWLFALLAVTFAAMLLAVIQLRIPEPIDHSKTPAIFWHAFGYRVAALSFIGETLTNRLIGALGWYGTLPFGIAIVVLFLGGLTWEWRNNRNWRTLPALLTLIWVSIATVMMLVLRPDYSPDYFVFKPHFTYWAGDRYFMPAVLVIFLFGGVVWSRISGERHLRTLAALGIVWLGGMYFWGYQFYPWTAWGPKFTTYLPWVEDAKARARADGQIHVVYIPIAPQPWFVRLEVGRRNGGGSQKFIAPDLKLTDYFNLKSGTQSGIRESEWFGSFDDSKYPWIFNETYGWMVCLRPSANGFWFWSPEQGYFVTNALRFPGVLKDDGHGRYVTAVLPKRP